MGTASATGGKLMRTPLVILIHGQKFNGKSTLATKIEDYLESTEHFIFNPNVYSLATPLKRQLAFEGGYEDPYKVHNELYDPVEKEKYRYAITTLADRTKADKGNRYYAHELIRGLQVDHGNSVYCTPLPIVDDIRYDYEIDAFRDAGFNVFTVKIIRPDAQALEVTHSSEQGLPDSMFDYAVLNTFEGVDDFLWKYEAGRLIKHWGYTCLR
jgi:hypothetical protein